MNKLIAAWDDGGGGGGGGGSGNPASVIGNIEPPSSIKELVGQGGATGLNTVLTNAIKLIYEVAIILFIFMILISAIQWITSGGEKEKIAGAQGRLTNAVIGLVILGLAWVIAATLGKLTGIHIPGT